MNESLQSPKSSVLIANHPEVDKVQLGAHCVASSTEAIEALNQSKYSTFVFSLNDFNLNELMQVKEVIESLNPNMKSIIINYQGNLEKLNFSINFLNAYKIIESFTEQSFEKYIFSSNEAFAQLQQNQQLIELFNEQNTKLRALKDDLELRIKKRKKSLTKSQKRYEMLSHAVQTLHKSLMIIHKAKSKSELELQLTELFKKNMNIEDIKIFPGSDITTEKSTPDLLELPLTSGGLPTGLMRVQISEGVELLRDEVNVLHQVADAIALSTDRLIKRQQAEVLKQQWETAFNSIQDPICLTNAKHQIIRTNQSFLRERLSESEDVIGRDCFDEFFEDSNVLKLAQQTDGHLFFQKTQTRLEGTVAKTFSVSIQKIPYKDFEEDFELVYFRDVTENLRLERQILESSKMAELGTISSSIAHELNNPLGGMISYLQLIKMDLNADDKLHEDITSMLDSAMKCKDIIENLLGFARRSPRHLNENVDLVEVLKKSINILELQTKSTNITIDLVAPEIPPEIPGDFNLLTQAMCNILQNSVDAIMHKFQDSPRYDGQIRIELMLNPKTIELIISDNGTGIRAEYQNQVFNPLFTTKNPDHNSGLGLTVAFQILNDHGGTLDIFSQPMAGTSAKISFERPDLVL